MAKAWQCGNTQEHGLLSQRMGKIYIIFYDKKKLPFREVLLEAQEVHHQNHTY